MNLHTEVEERIRHEIDRANVLFHAIDRLVVYSPRQEELIRIGEQLRRERIATGPQGPGCA